MAQVTSSAPALVELEKLIGVQTPLDQFHGVLRRAAQAVAGVKSFGTVQVTCSDEFQGEIRSNFDRDVARPLMAGAGLAQRRTFQLSNMGGRVEPGALTLADDHFSKRGQQGAKLLLIEIAAHVGVIPEAHSKRYGKLERLGRESDCCGALGLLIADPTTAAAVRHPWFDQLSTFFGEERLATLRADDSPRRMLSAAIVHAVLQGESAIADLMREPPPTLTHVLIATGVVLNQPGQDDIVPIGAHLLRSEGAELFVVHGASLRASPATLRYADVGGRLRVACDELSESATPRRFVREAGAELARHAVELPHASPEQARAREHVRAQLAGARQQVERLKRHPARWRVYARPVLRGLVQALSVAAPEFGLVAMLVQSGHDAARAEHLRRLLRTGPTHEEARAVLKHLEAEIQQLGHRDAQDVLDILLSEIGPSFALK